MYQKSFPSAHYPNNCLCATCSPLFLLVQAAVDKLVKYIDSLGHCDAEVRFGDDGEPEPCQALARPIPHHSSSTSTSRLPCANRGPGSPPNTANRLLWECT